MTSRDKAKSILLKGRLVDCNKSGLSALSVIIHQVTHGSHTMRHAMRKPIYKHRSTDRVKEIKQYKCIRTRVKDSTARTQAANRVVHIGCIRGHDVYGSISIHYICIFERNVTKYLSLSATLNISFNVVALYMHVRVGQYS